MASGEKERGGKDCEKLKIRVELWKVHGDPRKLGEGKMLVRPEEDCTAFGWDSYFFS